MQVILYDAALVAVFWHRAWLWQTLGVAGVLMCVAAFVSWLLIFMTILEYRPVPLAKRA